MFTVLIVGLVCAFVLVLTILSYMFYLKVKIWKIGRPTVLLK